MVKVIVVWCESSIGLITTRVDEDGRPVQFDSEELPDTVILPTTTNEIFDILKRRDGTKVAIYANSVNSILGWEI